MKTEFKSVKLRLKTDFVSYPTLVEELVNTHTRIYTPHLRNAKLFQRIEHSGIR